LLQSLPDGCQLPLRAALSIKEVLPLVGGATVRTISAYPPGFAALFQRGQLFAQGADGFP